MSDVPNNPVIQPPKPNISRTAAKCILAALQQMAGSGTVRQGRRNGKHNGQNAGAFGKQR